MAMRHEASRAERKVFQKLSIIEVQKRLQDRVQCCALCGSGSWELQPEIYGMKLAHPLTPKQSKQFPCAVLICHNCGNMHLISVEVLCADELNSPPTDEQPQKEE
ncbi:MAG: hypothetical protein C4523_02165 [Myxococcales bacterium]|nr:MAG: hypothetical protein C4523_02165 [Myxococcales bacterium]